MARKGTREWTEADRLDFVEALAISGHSGSACATELQRLGLAFVSQQSVSRWARGVAGSVQEANYRVIKEYIRHVTDSARVGADRIGPRASPLVETGSSKSSGAPRDRLVTLEAKVAQLEAARVFSQAHRERLLKQIVTLHEIAADGVAAQLDLLNEMRQFEIPATYEPPENGGEPVAAR